jgi:hypothetical protein
MLLLQTLSGRHGICAGRAATGIGSHFIRNPGGKVTSMLQETF